MDYDGRTGLTPPRPNHLSLAPQRVPNADRSAPPSHGPSGKTAGDRPHLSHIYAREGGTANRRFDEPQIATKERMMWILRRARQKTKVLLVDDLDGTLAHETVHFELDGKHYEIDLSAENAEELRRALDPYIDLAKIAYLEEMFT
jgi:hypothetical protein